jgi:tRNA G18 (ribose-2'-O)-methylase SpoU
VSDTLDAVGLHNPRLDPFRDLRRGPGPGRLVVEGALAVRRLLDAGPQSRFELESLVCTPSQRELLVGAYPRVEELTLELGRRELAELVGFDFHRGVLACARRPPTGVDEARLAELGSRARLTIVAAERLADPRNLGALVRNAAAFGVDAVLADARGADLFARLAIRASVGNVFRVPCFVVDEFGEAVAGLARALDASLVATTPAEDAEELRSSAATRPERMILLVGNEGAGLSEDSLARADARVRIPVDPASDSLNVAAATAVLLYELQNSPPGLAQP